jgi:Protein of unknown function (DUF4254)
VTEHHALPPAHDIVAQMDRAIMGESRRSASVSTDDPGWADLVLDLTQSNLSQWDLEDTTRDPGATDTEVADAKREIDRLNASRHRLVQAIDEAIDTEVSQAPTAPIATESPGMVLDRLSVLVIRRARTSVASSRDPGLAHRTGALESQLAVLCAALDSYVDELRTGKRRFIRYESFKLYGRNEAGSRPG